MTKIEYLSASLPNNQKIQWRDIGEPVLVEPRIIRYLFNNIELVKPIVRPLSDLTKPIIQANYNDGKAFVPIVELLKNSYFDTSKMENGEIMSFAVAYSRIELITLNDLPLYLKWHFDLITEDCEKVYVTETFNPYK